MPHTVLDRIYKIGVRVFFNTEAQRHGDVAGGLGGGLPAPPTNGGQGTARPTICFAHIESYVARIMRSKERR